MLQILFQKQTYAEFSESCNELFNFHGDDISADDVIEPSAVDYSYGLMFEERTIELMSYNVEILIK